ncbi:MAG TPA: hypothetical protein VGJ05_07030 [Fimbriiglobus sp.]|jgi:hypothetical protein
MPTPYDRLKLAWVATDRRTALNRTVEEMAAEGVNRVDLDAALGRLLDDVRAAGADDETEEEITGIGDRLHGWVVESRRIRTKPATTLGAAPPFPADPVQAPVS